LRTGPILTVLAALAGAVEAGTPVGVVASDEPVLLSGVPVPFRVVSSWPVVAGDEITTTASPALLLFRDKSRVVLDVKSRARLENDRGAMTFRLLEGSFSYDLEPGSALRIIAPDRAPEPEAGSRGGVATSGPGFVSPPRGRPPFTPPGPPPGVTPRSPAVPCGPGFDPPGPPQVIPPRSRCGP
jgi:hypothetical protein